MTLADQLYTALVNLMIFRDHLRNCEVAQTDTCTCGLKQRADEARAAMCAYRVRNGQ